MANRPMQVNSPRDQMRGAFGEEEAVGFLQRRGYSIVGRNVRCAVGEIDIVAKKGRELFFFEVKLRGRGSLVSAVETIHSAQRRRIRLAAEWYLMRHEREWKGEIPACSFGVIAIDDDPDGLHIELFEEAF